MTVCKNKSTYTYTEITKNIAHAVVHPSETVKNSTMSTKVYILTISIKYLF